MTFIKNHIKKQFFLGGVFFIALLNSCKTTQPMHTATRSLSAKKVAVAHREATFPEQTVRARIKVHYEDDKNSQKFTVKLRMKKDEVIWMSGSFLGFPVAKIKITPQGIQYYEKLRKTYFEGDFQLVNKLLGSNLSFQELQNILLGQAFVDLNRGKFKSSIDKQSYLLIPKKQGIFNFFYWINPVHYKIDKQEIHSPQKKQQLMVSYPEYEKITGVYFPKKIHIKAVHSQQIKHIAMEIRNVQFNKTLSFPFRIPSGYKEVVVDRGI